MINHIRSVISYARSRILKTPPWLLHFLSMILMFFVGRITCMLSHLPWHTDGVALFLAIIHFEPMGLNVLTLLLIPVGMAVYLFFAGKMLLRAAFRAEHNL